MAPDFDHLFICVSVGGAAEAGALTAFGLREGTPNSHPGQGTACRRFFFANSYLELLWVSDAADAQSKPIQPTHLWERWNARTSGMCPFGLGFRPKGEQDFGPPFSAFEYRPPYLRPNLDLHVATNAGRLTEPMLFYLPFALRPKNSPGAKMQVTAHPADLREITRLQFGSPHADHLSPEMSAVTGKDLVQLRTSLEYVIELGFDGESQGRRKDFRPLLPLVFHW
jgi:hypothetical protein